MKWRSFLLIVLSSFACSHNERIISYRFDDIKQGICREDSLHTYHYTLPKNNNTKLPLLVILDSGGDGLFAIQKVLPAAESIPCIIVASDLVKNNYPGFIKAIATLIKDVESRFPVDRDQVFIGGFSGGARMAFEYAMRYPLKGVLMCGAGPSVESANIPFPVYMVSGTTDFNFGEVYVNPLKTTENTHLLTDYFRGGHVWPPAENLQDGLIFLMAGQDSDLKKKQSLELTQLADSLIRINETLFGIKALEKAIRFNPSNRKAIKLDKKIRNDRQFARNLNKLESSLSLESRIGQAYAQATMSKDSIWWKNEISQVSKEIGASQGENRDHFMRIKAYLGILYFSRINALLSSDPGNKQIEHLLAAYRMAEPDNPDVYLNFARYEEYLGHNIKSDQYFKKAHALLNIKHQKEKQSQ